MTTGDATGLTGHFIGGSDPDARLAIHLRHYATSLATALWDKFPASAWLAGAAVLREAAGAYARLHPPLQPCIAEYGRDFPWFLARHPRAAQLPYLASFAELEWAVGQASIAIDAPALSWIDLANRGAERLIESTLALQPGVHYVRADWRVDELMQTYLGGAAPERFVLLDITTLIEVHGARGAFHLTRLDAATFVFRTALAAGRTLGDAADTALTIDATFDPGNALHALVDARLVTKHSIEEQEPAQ
jgi:hypothetical protein